VRRLKKVLKILALLLVLLVLAGGAFFVHVWYFKPYDINLFFARTAAQFALDSPELLSTLRVLEPLGITFYNDDLDDESIAAGDRMFARIRNARKVLLSYDDEDLDAVDRRSKEVMLGLLDILVEAERFRFHTYPVNQMFGVQNGFPTFMKDVHRVNDVGDAEDYIARLSKVGVKFDQVLEGLRHREQLGILPPQFLVDEVLEEMTGFTETPVEEGILYTALVEKMEKAQIEETERARVLAEARTEIERTVYPAYGRLIDYFHEIDPKVEGSYGVWNLPDGDEMYRLALRFFTTTDDSPQEIHEIGLGEVERIEGEILEILAAQGRDVSGGFKAAMAALKEDPSFYYPDTDEGREAILRDYRAILEEVEAGLDEAFDVRPKAALEVRREAAFKEKTAPGAHYEMPAMDGSRPGGFVVNLYDIKATPKYTMRTLAYHEGVPGHHFQIALELGFEDDPYDNVGRLQAELFRAVRLVVDTGIHHGRWSREQAIDYMLAHTGIAETDAVAEVERYFVLPGQACSYKVGMMKILELRERARTELGDAFDLRDFHRVVLTNGSMPLTLLDRLVDEYIARTKAQA
jgi:uncharacterized protein (DUF885 family)